MIYPVSIIFQNSPELVRAQASSEHNFITEKPTNLLARRDDAQGRTHYVIAEIQNLRLNYYPFPMPVSHNLNKLLLTSKEGSGSGKKTK